MSGNGVALNSASHQGSDIDPASVETVEIEVPDIRQRMPNRALSDDNGGVYFPGLKGDRVKAIRISQDGGVVSVWFEFYLPDGRGEYEALQYLNPVEAMAFAKAFERCAIQALKEIA